MIRNVDILIDMEPGGCKANGRIVPYGTPDEIRLCGKSRTGEIL